LFDAHVLDEANKLVDPARYTPAPSSCAKFVSKEALESVRFPLRANKPPPRRPAQFCLNRTEDNVMTVMWFHWRYVWLKNGGWWVGSKCRKSQAQVSKCVDQG
jgi:hypothetical protein